nr:hypothetical protein [Paracoccus mutanolyticus]
MLGEAGNDILTGGQGADRFGAAWAPTASSSWRPRTARRRCATRSRISRAQGDRIDLSAIDADRRAATTTMPSACRARRLQRRGGRSALWPGGRRGDRSGRHQRRPRGRHGLPGRGKPGAAGQRLPAVTRSQASPACRR